MPFNFTSMTRRVLDVLGVAVRAEYGVGVLSGGTLVVKTSFSLVEVAFAASQTANAARVSDVTADTITLTGTGTDAVMWMAIGRGGR